ncbi:unnamed protein product [Lactuca virosa]|uniref:Transferase, Chloramphenicol acetyltransferase-like domain protein n=1 Tax=Lactuca virosa TaxID=75947 RepID=A0AAU9LG00_9ASTR|nr:unnamed protein product [Lactuca virosa]
MMMMRSYLKRTISAPQYLLHSRFSHTPNPSMSTLSSSTFRHHYTTHDSSCRFDDENNITKRVDLEIISIGSIKPAYPTPNHLRTFNLSIIDQMFFDSNTPTILFLPNTDNTSVSDVIATRSGRLKESLSELLTQYYPFAGEIVDIFSIDCNDKGVYFVEARVNQTLQEFLHQPDDQKLKELIPKHPSITTESSLGNFVISVQVNVFNCGGIGLCTSLSHKIFDGTTYFTFMKAWATAARSGSSQIIPPCLVASDIFPNNPFIKQWPSKLWNTKLPCTKRFVFDSMALASLKAQPVSPALRGPTRTEVTAAVVWKAAAKAASTVRRFSPDSPHALFTFVNLRKRASPPLPTELIGNVISAGNAICFPNKQPDLATMIDEVRKSISKLDSGYVESLKREKGHETFIGFQKIINDLIEVMNEENCLFATSLLNTGIYEMDFGWGKPIWFYHMNPGCSRIVSLNEVKKGGGVEAVVSLSSEEMEIFECDPEVLSYATVNPSPLRFLN